MLFLVASALLAACDAGAPEEPEWRLPYEVMNTVDTYPAWSPDGRTIAYTHYPQTAETAAIADAEQVWLLDVATGERRYLTWGWYPAWSPDGSAVAFVRGAYGRAAVFVAEVATGAVRQVSPWGWNFFPSWSADGAKIAYAVHVGSYRDEIGVWVVNADGSGGARRVGYPHLGAYPAWSPVDAALLVYAVGVEEAGSPYMQSQLFTVDSTGAGVRRLTHIGRQAEYPSWSPDGRRIAFHSHALLGEPSPSPRIGIVNADGSGFRLLDLPGGFPSWGPDNHTLVYYEAFEELDGCRYRIPHGTLWLVGADGSNRRPLTRPEDYRETECSAHARAAASAVPFP